MSQSLAAEMKTQNPDKITFCEHSLPALKGGKHTISVEQTVDFKDKSSFLVDAHKNGQKKYEAERSFYVNADRFLLPRGSVKSVFPPRNADGSFGLVLPHVVLADKMLPWVWTLDSAPIRSGDTTPWLALLVFTLEESIPEVVPRRLGDLNKAETGVLCYPGVELSGDVEDLDATVLTIDIPVDLYREIVPTAAELKYLAHTRVVGVESRKMKSSDQENSPEEYGVVVANRLPRTEKTVVHLVALVGMRRYLPNSGTALPGGTEFVRLVSIENWQFLTAEPVEDFKFLVLQTLKKDDPSTLRLPSIPVQSPGQEDGFIENGLSLGYTALNHFTRAGDQTVSWYRGPLIPYPAAPNAVTLPAFNSDSLTRYDNQTGLFDVSYAAAWQLGRLLALQDKEFAVSLYNWKLNSQIEDIRDAEQEIIEGTMGSGLAARLQRRRTTGNRAAARLTDSLLELLAEEAPPVLEQTANGSNGNGASGSAVSPSKLPKITFDTLLNRVTSPLGRNGNSDRQPLPDLVKEWLGRLRLLRGVPFSYLVPDERMLPPESLRFIYLDRNWINSITDGALSIGRSTEGMLSQDRANFGYFEQEALAACTRERAARLNIPEIRSLRAAGDISGFVLHSRIVTDYPGIEAQGLATADITDRNFLEIFHFQRIAEDVLLCLFAGAVQQVRIMLPSEGINFGVDWNEATKTFRKKPLRSVSPPLGNPLPEKSVDIPFRIEAKRVVNVQNLADALKREVSPSDPFTSAEYSLEMADEGPIVIFWTAPEVS